MPTPKLLNPNKKHTLILVKPDGFTRGLTGGVLCCIEAKGYIFKGLKVKRASKESFEEHYAEHRDQYFFPNLFEFMSSSPFMAAVVEGDRVVEGTRILMGTTSPTLATPGTIRGDLRRNQGSRYVGDVTHGLDSPTSAEREVALWLPELVYHEWRGYGRGVSQTPPAWRFFASTPCTEIATVCLHGSYSLLLQGIVKGLILWQHNAATIEQDLGGGSIRRC